MEAAALYKSLASRLAPAGVDIVHLLALGWYNSSIPDELGARIPASGSAGQGALAVLFGNSRAVWEAFLGALAASEELQQADNPLELHLERSVKDSLGALAPGVRYRIYWSHKRTTDLEPPAGGGEASQHVAFQRMAHHSGLAFLDHDSHLCLHPRFGPWFSLRCVAIFDDIYYTEPKPAELAHPLPTATQLYVKMALHTAVHNTSRKFRLSEVDVEAAEAVLAESSIEPVLDANSDDEEGEEDGQGGDSMAGASTRPSTSVHSMVGSEHSLGSAGSTPLASNGCSSPQSESEVVAAAAPIAAHLAGSEASALARSVDATAVPGPTPVPVPGPVAAPKQGKPSMRAVVANWRAWVAVRDSPCPGHPMRYSEEQIEYHYTRNRSVLVKALMRRDLIPSNPALLGRLLPEPALQSYHKATQAAQGRSVCHTYSTAGAGTGPSAAAQITAP